MSLRVEAVRSSQGLEALRPAWLELWRRVPDATPFQSPAWLIPWWQAFGEGAPLVLALRQDGRLVGLAPFYVLPEPSLRKLLPLGAGISDYLDPLLDPDHTAVAAPALLAWLAREASSFDRIDIAGLRPGSALLGAPAPQGWRAAAVPIDSTPVLELPHGISRSRRAKLPYYRRRAERLGRVELVRANRQSLPQLLQELFELHGRRWQQRGQPGVLANDRVRAFHSAAAPALLAQGLLRFFALRIAGRPAAMVYGLADATRWHSYITAFDPGLPHPGLGTMLLGMVVEAAVADGVRELHMLRGREPYKYAWGALDRPLWGLIVQPEAGGGRAHDRVSGPAAGIQP
jgi:CelD/BcsL family acetyltransferase involved in cellulose biosynthesis